MYGCQVLYRVTRHLSENNCPVTRVIESKFRGCECMGVKSYTGLQGI